MDNAIEIEGISKRFRLYHEKYSSLKEKILHAGHIPYEEFWALKEVNAEIEAGQTVGILGRNGSGKSTLLKCIAGILQPTEGKITVRGQLAAMLELGAGFQPELSGRDNIYLNASLLGFSRKDIDRRFDAIVEFAELEQFIDNQVKYYSSGMYVRLGFAVAVNVEPDVLLVDEVLAVGDERFQAKCLERVYEFQKEGRTIVVVSHSPDMLRQICENILVFDSGELLTVAPPGEAIRIFRDRLIDSGLALPTEEQPVALQSFDIGGSPRRDVHITDVTIEYPGSDERPYLITGEPLAVRVAFDVNEPVIGANFSIDILSENSAIFSSKVTAYGDDYVMDRGPNSIAFVFDSVPLLDGRFGIHINIRDGGGVVLDFAEGATTFEVMNPTRATGLVAMPMRIEVGPGVQSGLAERAIS